MKVPLFCESFKKWQAQKNPHSQNCLRLRMGKTHLTQEKKAASVPKRPSMEYKPLGLPDVMGILNESQPSPVVKDAVVQCVLLLDCELTG
ncbi:hypothetical protein PM8797T_06085 [Gimesia maris DSM 8797]|jgi:hypothetical protein|nr:hypothetical protein PM8797T_06085 [Gimesia maris DSM 8797]|tara:strand:+ start:111 stop:380 length:270 start_codon:yes stop_codon:yes gene_type:complete